MTETEEDFKELISVLLLMLILAFGGYLVGNSIGYMRGQLDERLRATFVAECEREGQSPVICERLAKK